MSFLNFTEKLKFIIILGTHRNRYEQTKKKVKQFYVLVDRVVDTTLFSVKERVWWQ